MDPVEQLQTWFGKLGYFEKREVLEFLYGDLLLQEGLNVGPPPIIRKGLRMGDVPVDLSKKCPTCGRPM